MTEYYAIKFLASGFGNPLISAEIDAEMSIEGSGARIYENAGGRTTSG